MNPDETRERPLECSNCSKSLTHRYQEVKDEITQCFYMCDRCPALEKMCSAPASLSSPASSNLSCGVCQTSLSAIQHGELMGCSQCYSAFESYLIKEFKITFDLPEGQPVQHQGHKPGQPTEINPSLKIMALNEALTNSLNEENYEQAAWIRDQIQELKKKPNSLNLMINAKNFTDHFWAAHENKIWLATLFRVHRNLKTHQFPHKLKADYIHDLTNMLRTRLSYISPFSKGKFEYLKNISAEEKQLIHEFFLTEKNYGSFHGNEGLFISADHKQHILMNGTDHLVFHLVDTQNHLEKLWNQFIKLENFLSKDIEFAFNPTFGFLTSNPEQCGCGLQVQILMHLPALMRHKQDYLHLISDENRHINMKALDGSHDAYMGDLVFISNQQNIAVSEENILKTMHSCALDLLLAEKKAREEYSNSLQNDVNKAFGLLKHALHLDLNEAFHDLSLCKLGLDQNWVKGIDPKKMNAALFSIRKGLIALLQKEGQNIEQKRALYIQSHLENAQT